MKLYRSAEGVPQHKFHTFVNQFPALATLNGECISVHF